MEGKSPHTARTPFTLPHHPTYSCMYNYMWGIRGCQGGVTIFEIPSLSSHPCDPRARAIPYPLHGITIGQSAHASRSIHDHLTHGRVYSHQICCGEKMPPLNILLSIGVFQATSSLNFSELFLQLLMQLIQQSGELLALAISEAAQALRKRALVELTGEIPARKPFVSQYNQL